MGEPLIIVAVSSILNVGRRPGSVSDIFCINYKRLVFESIKSMFISKLNSKCVFKYPFDGSKILPLAECFKKKQNRTCFFCLVITDSISTSVLPTKCSKVQ